MNNVLSAFPISAGYLQQAESKLRNLSIGVRQKDADPRFEDIKNYADSLHVSLVLRLNSSLIGTLSSHPVACVFIETSLYQMNPV